jgi:hypothetical protein
MSAKCLNIDQRRLFDLGIGVQVMLRSVFARPLWPLALLAPLLAGCTALPDLAVVFEAVTFVHDERSGHRGEHVLKMALVTSAADVTAVWRMLERADPDAAAALDKNCRRRTDRAYYLLPPADVIVSAGQLAYSLVIGQLESKIKKLEEESQATYAFRRANTFSWQNLRCLVAWRHPEGKSAEIDMLVLLGREHLADGNVLRIHYVRINRAIAKTAAGTEQKLAAIQLDIAVSVFAAHTEKNKPVVSQLTHQVFRPLTKVVVGKPATFCLPPESPFETSCNLQSELFPNPPPKSTAFSLAIAVTETGSALGQVARAKASLASLDALVKPKFEAILKQAIAETTK